MASVAARGLLCRALPKLKELSALRPHYPSANVLLVRLNGGCHGSHSTAFQPNCTGRRLRTQPAVAGVLYYSDGPKDVGAGDGKEKKLSLFQRFKQMYKEYWYVLVPVHLVTSAAWFGGFYYLAKSGVDIVAILESWHVSERITNPLKDSSMGYLAIAYALYKISTPARYTVTLGGTTLSINYLKKWGYIKPVPSAERLKEIYHEKKGGLLDVMRETRDGLKDKKEDIMDDFDKGIKQIKEMGDKIKSKEGHHVIEEVKKEGKKGKK